MPDKSSLKVRGENNRDCIGEISLLGDDKIYETLSDAIKAAFKDGYVPYDIRTANFIHGSPDENEPRAVLLLTNCSNACVDPSPYRSTFLITKGPDDGKYHISNWQCVL